jgi:dTDP-4-amino-4,6-dideoxygalactose transaminase
MKEAGLKALRLSRVTEGAEANPWFWFLHYEKRVMKVSRARCAAALQAEGLPVGAHYLVPMYKQKWIRERNTYGDSHYPWSAAKGRKYDYEGTCPNAERAIADHMTLFFHEGCGDQEIKDIVAALKKVERRYLK